jgi:hypothetical protein
MLPLLTDGEGGEVVLAKKRNLHINPASIGRADGLENMVPGGETRGDALSPIHTRSGIIHQLEAIQFPDTEAVTKAFQKSIHRSCI